MTNNPARVHPGVPTGGQFAATSHKEPEVSLIRRPELAPPLELEAKDAFKMTAHDDNTQGEDWTNYSRFTTYKPTPAAAPALRRLLGLPEGSRAPVTISRHEFGSGDGWALDESHDSVEVWSGKLKLELENEDPMERLLTRINHAHRNPQAEVERLRGIDEEWRRAADFTFDDGSVEECGIEEIDRAPSWQKSKMRFQGPGTIIVDIVQQGWCKD